MLTILLGLQIMHKHGYVHRDISTGNIILHDGRGKLSDLKYAKEIGKGEMHEVRTVCFLFTLKTAHC